MLAYQRGEIVPCFSAELVLIPEAEYVLYIGNKVVRAGVESDVDQKRHK